MENILQTIYFKLSVPEYGEIGLYKIEGYVAERNEPEMYPNHIYWEDVQAQLVLKCDEETFSEMEKKYLEIHHQDENEYINNTHRVLDCEMWGIANLNIKVVSGGIMIVAKEEDVKYDYLTYQSYQSINGISHDKEHYDDSEFCDKCGNLID